MKISWFLEVKKAELRKFLLHLKPKHLFRTRLSRLCPVVALDENAMVVYGRYDVYNIFNEDNPHSIVSENTDFIDCFAVRKLTEEQYIQILLRREKQ